MVYDHKLPETLIPDGDVCVPVSIPAHADYVALFLGAVRQLTYDFYYERDDNQSGVIVRRQFQDRTLIPLINALSSDENCPAKGCETFETWNDIIDFYPNDPYINSENFPDIYLKWERFENLIGGDVLPEWLSIIRDNFAYDASGYLPDDCLLVINTLSLNPIKRIEQLLEQFTSFPLPTITINVNGTGTIGLEFLNVPLGGRAIILEDIDLSLDTIYRLITDTLSQNEQGILNSLSIVELNRDLLSIPPETATTQVQEVVLNDAGDHTIRVIFVPAFNDEIPFVFPFAGIRSVRICENLNVYGIKNDGIFVTKYQKREGVIGMATQQEFYDALLKYETEKANRWLLASASTNIKNPVKIGLDGVVAVDKTGNLVLDAATANASEAHNGSVYNQALEIKNLFDTMNTQQTNGYSANSIISISKLIINPFDVAAWTTLISDYVTSVEVISINVAVLAERIFCHGFSNGVVGYAIYFHTEAEMLIINDIALQIPETTLSDWYNAGAITPRNYYTNYACFRQPMQTTTLLPAQLFNGIAGAKNLDNIFAPLPNKAAGNRWIFQISGKFIHTPTGDEFTFFYKTESGITTSTSAQVRINVGQGKPFDSIPIFASDGIYNAYHTQAFAVGIYGFYFGAIPAWAAVDVTGSIVAEKYDLGS